MFKVGDRVKPKVKCWRAHEKAEIVEINWSGTPTYKLLFDRDRDQEDDGFNWWYYNESIILLNGIELILETFEE
jgi:hypothetical protein